MTPVRPAVVLKRANLRVILQVLALGIPPERPRTQVKHIIPRLDTGLLRFEVLAPRMPDTYELIPQRRSYLGNLDIRKWTSCFASGFTLRGNDPQ